MFNSRLINTKVAGGGCTDIVDNYNPFGGNGVALYQLNGDATDESGNYDGNFVNPAYDTGIFGQAGVFNGSSSYISTGIPIDSYSERSYSFWFKQNSNTGNSRIFGGVDGSATNGGMFRIRKDNGDINYYSINNTTFTWTFTLTDDVWTYISLTDNGTTAKLYINGSEIINVSITSYSTVTNTNLQIGRGMRNTGSIGDYTNGLIDQVRIFNTALTPLEVEALYTEELCICGGTVDTLDILGDDSCIATYQLDGNANDLSGNYSGTSTGVSYGVGEFDLAGVFNGSSSIITNTNQVIPNGAASLSFWYNNNGIGGTNYIIGNGVATNSKGLTVAYGSNTFTFFIFKGVTASSLTLSSANTFLNNVWYNIVIVWDGTTNSNSAKLYINGELESQGTPNLDSASIGSYTSFGIGGVNGGGYAAGSIDQVRIFNKALNQADVTTLFNETACATETKATFVAATNAGLAYTTHPTGKVGWANVTPNPFGLRGESVLYNGNHWVATGRSDNAAAYSPNGISWTLITSIPPGGSNVGWNGEYWLMTTDSSAYYTSDETGATGWTQVTNGISGETASSANNILWDGSDWLVAGRALWRINGSNPNGTAITVLPVPSGGWHQVAWQGPTGNVIIGTRNSVSTNAYYMTSFTSSPISASISTSGVQTGTGATTQGAIIGSTSLYTRYSSDGASYTDGGSSGYIGGVNYNGEVTVIGSASNTSGAIRFIDGENINQDINNIPETLIGIGTGIRFIATNNDQYRYVINE